MNPANEQARLAQLHARMERLRSEVVAFGVAPPAVPPPNMTPLTREHLKKLRTLNNGFSRPLPLPQPGVRVHEIGEHMPYLQKPDISGHAVGGYGTGREGAHMHQMTGPERSYRQSVERAYQNYRQGRLAAGELEPASSCPMCGCSSASFRQHRISAPNDNFVQRYMRYHEHEAHREKVEYTRQQDQIELMKNEPAEEMWNHGRPSLRSYLEEDHMGGCIPYLEDLEMFRDELDSGDPKPWHRKGAALQSELCEDRITAQQPKASILQQRLLLSQYEKAAREAEQQLNGDSTLDTNRRCFDGDADDNIFAQSRSQQPESLADQIRSGKHY